MAKPYSEDLRERAVGAVTAGARRHAAAARFEVSVSSGVRWVQRWRGSGEIAAKARGKGLALRPEDCVKFGDPARMGRAISRRRDSAQRLCQPGRRVAHRVGLVSRFAEPERPG